MCMELKFYQKQILNKINILAQTTTIYACCLFAPGKYFSDIHNSDIKEGMNITDFISTEKQEYLVFLVV